MQKKPLYFIWSTAELKSRIVSFPSPLEYLKIS
jgi:hypothetical protein